ncbi:hypothetical protein O181_105292 [Austropuccinia psidii MF-1]|uniref:Uncharacterized protein n=1 Tax=Austropuccinia psidii MF-1 TaxID=1389203 RepID=A0A9Q3JPS4_9BASI|nr:hypothetical protein [Austropuccinia psidii MF-1]
MFSESVTVTVQFVHHLSLHCSLEQAAVGHPSLWELGTAVLCKRARARQVTNINRTCLWSVAAPNVLPCLTLATAQLTAPLQVGNKVENILVSRSPDEYHQSGASWSKGDTTRFREAYDSAKAGFNSYNQPYAEKSSQELDYYNKSYNKGQIYNEQRYEDDDDYRFW